MQVNYKQLRVNLHPDVYSELEKRLNIGTPQEKTISTLVREALEAYLSQGVGVSKEAIKEPVGSILHPGIGVTMPETKVNEPGPGAAGRLQAAGINPVDVVRARRAKRFGREYDKSLEPYFDMLSTSI